jgi:hypothetical protein
MLKKVPVLLIITFVLLVKTSFGISSQNLNKTAVITFRELLELRLEILANSLSKYGLGIHLKLTSKNKIRINIDYLKSSSSDLKLLEIKDKKKEILNTFNFVKEAVLTLIKNRFPFLSLDENEDFLGIIKAYKKNLGLQIIAKWGKGKFIWLTEN